MVVREIPKVGGGVPNLKVHAKLLCSLSPTPSVESPNSCSNPTKFSDPAVCLFVPKMVVSMLDSPKVSSSEFSGVTFDAISTVLGVNLSDSRQEEDRWYNWI